MKNFAVVLLTIALAACASHGVNLSDGTEKPAPDDAVIRVWSPSSGLVRVSAVDGRERGNYTSHVYVRPGDHQLTVISFAICRSRSCSIRVSPNGSWSREDHLQSTARCRPGTRSRPPSTC